jgi:hypothetical protein
VAWDVPSGDASKLIGSPLDWQGQRNRYDLGGKARFILTPPGNLASPELPSASAPWTAAVEDRESADVRVLFKSEPEDPRSESALRPENYALVGLDLPIGPEVSRIGPTIKEPTRLETKP